MSPTGYLRSGDHVQPNCDVLNSWQHQTADLTARSRLPEAAPAGCPCGSQPCGESDAQNNAQSICFALSSMAQISIWTSLCFAFTKHFKKKKSVLWKFHLTVLGFSSHVCMYLLGLYRSFNLSFVLSVTIFCHIYSRTEKITLPKGGIVLIFASHLLFDFLFHW